VAPKAELLANVRLPDRSGAAQDIAKRKCVAALDAQGSVVDDREVAKGAGRVAFAELGNSFVQINGAGAAEAAIAHDETARTTLDQTVVRLAGAEGRTKDEVALSVVLVDDKRRARIIEPEGVSIVSAIKYHAPRPDVLGYQDRENPGTGVEIFLA
jgi:hypothetical protein